jgi:hypothetical protein
MSVVKGTCSGPRNGADRTAFPSSGEGPDGGSSCRANSDAFGGPDVPPVNCSLVGVIPALLLMAIGDRLTGNGGTDEQPGSDHCAQQEFLHVSILLTM